MQVKFRGLLLKSAALGELVGGQITWGQRNKGAGKRALNLIEVPTGDHDYTLGGPSGLNQSFVTAECWGATYAEADALAQALLAGFDGLTDPASGLDLVKAEGRPRDGSEYTAPNNLFCRSQDLRITWRNPA